MDPLAGILDGDEVIITSFSVFPYIGTEGWIGVLIQKEFNEKSIDEVLEEETEGGSKIEKIHIGDVEAYKVTNFNNYISWYLSSPKGFAVLIGENAGTSQSDEFPLVESMVSTFKFTDY